MNGVPHLLLPSRLVTVLAAAGVAAACTIFAADRIPCDFDTDCASSERCIDFFCEARGDDGDEALVCLPPPECIDDDVDEGDECMEQISGWTVTACSSVDSCAEGHCVLLRSNAFGCAPDPAITPCTSPFIEVNATNALGAFVRTCGDPRGTCERGTCTAPGFDCRTTGRCPPGLLCDGEGACVACTNDDACVAAGLGGTCDEGVCTCADGGSCADDAQCLPR